MDVRCSGGAPCRSSTGWSCRRCSTASCLPSASGGPLSVRRAPTLTLRQKCWTQMQERLRSIAQDSVHPEQKLRGRNCALFLGACKEGCAEEKAQGTAELENLHLDLRHIGTLRVRVQNSGCEMHWRPSAFQAFWNPRFRSSSTIVLFASSPDKLSRSCAVHSRRAGSFTRP